MNWGKSRWFTIVAVFSFSFAPKGYLSSKLKKQNWLRNHIAGMLGSYIAMTTALLVVNTSRIPGSESVPNFVFWLLSTLIGTPLITRTIRKNTKASGPHQSLP